MAEDEHTDASSTPPDPGYVPQAGTPSHRDRRNRPDRGRPPDLLHDAQHRAWRRGVVAAGWWVVMFTLTHWPRLGKGGGLDLDIPYADKLAHFGLFCGWFVLFAWALERLDWSRLRITATLLIGGAVYAAIDESTQAFVPGRSPSMLDFAADGLGLIAGWGILSIMKRSA